VETGPVAAVGIDKVRRRVGDDVALQGNLDPGALLSSTSVTTCCPRPIRSTRAQW